MNFALRMDLVLRTDFFETFLRPFRYFVFSLEFLVDISVADGNCNEFVVVVGCVDSFCSGLHDDRDVGFLA